MATATLERNEVELHEGQGEITEGIEPEAEPQTPEPQTPEREYVTVTEPKGYRNALVLVVRVHESVTSFNMPNILAALGKKVGEAGLIFETKTTANQAKVENRHWAYIDTAESAAAAKAGRATGGKLKAVQDKDLPKILSTMLSLKLTPEVQAAAKEAGADLNDWVLKLACEKHKIDMETLAQKAAQLKGIFG